MLMTKIETLALNLSKNPRLILAGKVIKYQKQFFRNLALCLNITNFFLDINY